MRKKERPNTPKPKIKAPGQHINRFHQHLDECRRCREEVFNLCPVGAKILEEEAGGTTMEQAMTESALKLMKGRAGEKS